MPDTRRARKSKRLLSGHNAQLEWLGAGREHNAATERARSAPGSRPRTPQGRELIHSPFGEGIAEPFIVAYFRECG